MFKSVRTLSPFRHTNKHTMESTYNAKLSYNFSEFKGACDYNDMRKGSRAASLNQILRLSADSNIADC